MEAIRVTKRDALRAMFAGARGVALRPVAQRLYELGGRAVLPPVAQGAIRGALEAEATQLMAGTGLLFEGARKLKGLGVGGTLASDGAKSVAATTARAAGQQMLRGIGRAAGIGAL